MDKSEDILKMAKDMVRCNVNGRGTVIYADDRIMTMLVKWATLEAVENYKESDDDINM